jgi:acetyl/propionyl-CoA carboxylase alpha subunit
VSELEGTADAAEVVALGDGRYLIAHGARRQLAFAVSDGSDLWVFLDGRVHVVPARVTPTAQSPRDLDQASLSAPMPATVSLVNVVPGQEVEAGDTLLVLEAMKMELPITAPRRGRVSSIRCKVGELVAPGTPLVEME